MTNIVAYDPGSRPLVGALRHLLRTRTVHIAARQLFWKRLSIGGLILLICALLASLVYFFPSLIKKSNKAQELSQALQSAFEKTNFKVETTGELHLAQPAEVTLAPGASVALKQNQGKPSASTQLPKSDNQQAKSPQPAKSNKQSEEKDKTVFDFVVFKSIPFGQGNIETAWNYRNSNQETPTSQNCKYRKSLNVGQDQFVLLAIDGAPKVNPKSVDFDVYDALKNCVWFSK